MIKYKLIMTSIVCLLILATSSTGHAAKVEKKDDAVNRFEDKDLIVVIGSRTPEQLAAFYTGRGFNQASIDVIIKTCFVFGMVDNKTYETLWLSLDEWKFIAADGSQMKRFKRDHWMKTWQQTGLSQSHQSTFGWTQLPENRDLRMHEVVGGNVAVEWQDMPFTLEATFRTGADKTGKPHIITVEDLTCTSH